MSQSVALGVDIGGSHITAALVNLETAALQSTNLIRKKVDPHGTADELIRAWSAAIKAVEGFSKDLKIGIAMPGPFDYEQGISYIKDQDKFDALYKKNVKELLATFLGIETGNVRLMNDAGSFLRGEVFDGAAKGAKNAIGLTLGTGLGGAKYHSGNAADAKLWCVPFRDGIAEDYLSTRWFTHQYQVRTGRKVKDVKALAEIAGSDEVAGTLFQEFGSTLAEFLISIVKADGPEVLILGGNIANALGLFKSALENEFRKNAIILPVKKALLGEEAALIGAASCWNRNG